MRKGWRLLFLGSSLLAACGDIDEASKASEPKEGEEQPFVERESSTNLESLTGAEQGLPEGLYGYWVVSPEAVKEINQRESGAENQLGLAALLMMMVVLEIDREYITMHFRKEADSMAYRVVQAGDDAYSIEVAGESQGFELRGDVLFIMGEGPEGVGLSRLAGEKLARRKAKLAEAKARALAGPGRDAEPDDRITWMMNVKAEAVAAKLKEEPELARLLGKGNRTTLHYAAKFKRAELVSLLLEHGANPKAVSNYGRSPLHEAVAAPSSPASREIIVELLAAGCDLKQADKKERTPLSQVHSAEVAELLLARGADPRGKGARACLSNAVQREDVELIQVFLKRGAETNDHLNEDGDRLLHLAVAQRKSEMVAWLLERGADPREGNKNGTVPLFYTVAQDDDSIMKLLLSQGADPDGPRGRGPTPLAYAAQLGKVDRVKILLAAGADPNAPSAGLEGNSTPLIEAVVNGHVGVGLVLLQAGAKTDVVGPDGMTPVDLAQNSEDPTLWNLLPEGLLDRPTEKRDANGLIEVNLVLGGRVTDVKGIRWDTRKGKPVSSFRKKKSIRAEVALPGGKTLKLPSYNSFQMDQSEGVVRSLVLQPSPRPIDYGSALVELESWVRKLGDLEAGGVAKLGKMKALSADEAGESRRHVLPVRRENLGVEVVLERAGLNPSDGWMLQLQFRR